MWVIIIWLVMRMELNSLLPYKRKIRSNPWVGPSQIVLGWSYWLVADACHLLQLGTLWKLELPKKNQKPTNKNTEKDRKKSQTADILKAENGKDQQVEQTSPTFSPEIQKTWLGSIASSHMREWTRSWLRKVLFKSYSNLEFSANVSESKGRQQILLICWCYGFRSVQNAHLDQGEEHSMELLWRRGEAIN